MNIILTAICLGMTYIASQSNYWILKVFTGFFWWGFAFYWTKNPIEDANLQTIVVMLCIGIGIACHFWAFWYVRKDAGGRERSSFRFPGMRTDDQEVEYQRLNRSTSRNERIDSYRQRTNDAVRGNRISRRY